MHEPREGAVLAGKYRVQRVLGTGGMGVVVAATHIQLGQQVALKFMLPDALANAEASGRFLREARAAVKLKSEHVAKVLDVGTLDTGAPYIVMEYLEGTDLGTVLRNRGTLPLDEAAEYVLHACDALAEAHAVGIVHRDVKPGNLFVTHRPDGSPLVKVLDFGISKASLGDSNPTALTRTASMLGTPLYMSPEQMKSARDVDARSDVWSLGVIVYEMLGGRLPFDAETIGALMAKVLVEAPVPLDTLDPRLPREVVTLVESCLEKDVARRCPHVAEIAACMAPFAPPRARPLAERVSGILGIAPTSRAESHAASPARRAGPRAPTTAAAWDTASAIPRTRLRLPWLLVLGAVGAAVLAVPAFLLARRGDPNGLTTAATTAAAVVLSAEPVASAPVRVAPLADPQESPPLQGAAIKASAAPIGRGLTPPNPAQNAAQNTTGAIAPSKRGVAAPQPLLPSARPTADASPPAVGRKPGTAGHTEEY